jgi:O-acetyl-ADP-ribose deacetylase
VFFGVLCILKLIKSSILDIDAEIIVMSANPSLLAGSGVSGVIHKAAGPELETHVKAFGPLDVGQAILTPAFNLKAKYVVHTVCPRFYDGLRGESEQLRAAYSNALMVCDAVSTGSRIAFVAMGTGIYKWPTNLAASIAIKELSKSKFDETFVCFTDDQILQVYKSFSV